MSVQDEAAVLDELDASIAEREAEQVARREAELGKRRQVFVALGASIVASAVVVSLGNPAVLVPLSLQVIAMGLAWNACRELDFAGPSAAPTLDG